MVPRICSILSLSPYWGTLIPCLKEMGKDFIKFMVLIVIVYLGFLTTFSLVGRDSFTLSRMTMILTKIFFGSSSIGFDIMEAIDPVFGPPLMIIFITLSSILLMGSLTGMLSNSFSRVITHAREEYLYVYSVYVLEASTSNRLTHFYPPFNILALLIFRPMRLVPLSHDRVRQGRILLLRATHLPIVGVIRAYELLRGSVLNQDEYAGFNGPKESSTSSKHKSHRSHRQHRLSSSYAPRISSPRASGENARSDTSSSGDDDAGEPDEAQVRISDLAQKIDKLTALVMMLQDQQKSQNNETS